MTKRNLEKNEPYPIPLNHNSSQAKADPGLAPCYVYTMPSHIFLQMFTHILIHRFSDVHTHYNNVHTHYNNIFTNVYNNTNIYPFAYVVIFTMIIHMYRKTVFIFNIWYIHMLKHFTIMLQSSERPHLCTSAELVAVFLYPFHPCVSECCCRSYQG